MMIIYIAGPMRGYFQYNFQAFMDAELVLIENGHACLNPAQADLDRGFDPNTPEEDLTPEFLRTAMEWDVKAVLQSDGIVLLPGWEESKGANVEKALAEWIGIPVFLFNESDRENPLIPLDPDKGQAYTQFQVTAQGASQV